MLSRQREREALGVNLLQVRSFDCLIDSTSAKREVFHMREAHRSTVIACLLGSSSAKREVYHMRDAHLARSASLGSSSAKREVYHMRDAHLARSASVIKSLLILRIFSLQMLGLFLYKKECITVSSVYFDNNSVAVQCEKFLNG